MLAHGSARYHANLERHTALNDLQEELRKEWQTFQDTYQANIESGKRLVELMVKYTKTNTTITEDECEGFGVVLKGALKLQTEFSSKAIAPFLYQINERNSMHLENLKKIQEKYRFCMVEATRYNTKAASTKVDGKTERTVKQFAKVRGKLNRADVNYGQTENEFEHAMEDFETENGIAMMKHMRNFLDAMGSMFNNGSDQITSLGDYLSDFDAQISSKVKAFQQHKGELMRSTQRMEEQSNDGLLDKETYSNYMEKMGLGYVPTLCEGEGPVILADQVLHIADLGGVKHEVGALMVTGLRLGFYPVLPTKPTPEEVMDMTRRGRGMPLEVPLLLISHWRVVEQSTTAEGEDDNTFFVIWLKDRRVLSFSFAHSDMSPTKFSSDLSLLFFHSAYMGIAYHHRLVEEPGWNVYHPQTEFKRMGLPDAIFRLSALNQHYDACPTYPTYMMVPARFSDQDLIQAAKHRSKKRVSALVWKEKDTRIGIFRCSQPRVGLTKRRSWKDEEMLTLMGHARLKEKPHPYPLTTSTVVKLYQDEDEKSYYEQHSSSFLDNPEKTLIIVDARPQKNAVANLARGGGWERSDNYVNCHLAFLNIENIHEVRSGFETLQNGLALLPDPNIKRNSLTLDDSSATQSDTPKASTVPPTSSSSSSSFRGKSFAMGKKPSKKPWYMSKVLQNRYRGLLTEQQTRGKYFKNLATILKGNNFTVECIHKARLSCVVHCSDGWDRAPQLTALAQICLDPFYRTFRGFAILIEKDFVSFGHKFAQRRGYGLASRQTPGDTQRSPIILQFMDCIFQLLHQFPKDFEFNADFLADMMDYIDSCRFGNFLFNNQRERHENKVWEKTASLWTFVLQPVVMEYYRNPHFKLRNVVLLPSPHQSSLQLFLPYFIRFDQYLNLLKSPAPGLPLVSYRSTNEEEKGRIASWQRVGYGSSGPKDFKTGLSIINPAISDLETPRSRPDGPRFTFGGTPLKGSERKLPSTQLTSEPPPPASGAGDTIATPSSAHTPPERTTEELEDSSPVKEDSTTAPEKEGGK